MAWLAWNLPTDQPTNSRSRVSYVAPAAQHHGRAVELAVGQATRREAPPTPSLSFPIPPNHGTQTISPGPMATQQARMLDPGPHLVGVSWGRRLHAAAGLVRTSAPIMEQKNRAWCHDCCCCCCCCLSCLSAFFCPPPAPNPETKSFKSDGGLPSGKGPRRQQTVLHRREERQRECVWVVS